MKNVDDDTGTVKEGEGSIPTEIGGKQAATLLILSAANFFREHPAILGSLMYLLVTAIGIIYSRILYLHFGINIFDFAEMSDLLLAAFKNTFAFTMSILTLILGVGWVLLLPRMLRRWPRWTRGPIPGAPHLLSDRLDRASERFLELYRSSPILIAMVFVVIGLYTSVPAFVAAKSEARSILNAREELVKVTYRATAMSATPKIETNVELIGTTEKVAFFYDTEDKRTLVIPHAQIVSIEFPDLFPDLRQQKGPEPLRAPARR